jgi:hypothetical protein
LISTNRFLQASYSHTLVDSYHFDAASRMATWFIGQVDPGTGCKLSFSAAIRGDTSVGTVVTNYPTVNFSGVPEKTYNYGVAVIVPPKVNLSLIMKQT